MLARRMEREVDEIELTPVVDGETLLRMQRALEQVHVSEQVGLYMVDLVDRDAHVDARAGRSVAARDARAAASSSRGRAALARPRLRHARRRQGGRRAGARAPPDAAPGALGAAR